MRLLFLEIEAERDWSLASVGPAALGAAARQHGHDVALLSVPLHAALHTVVEQVRRRAPHLLGVSLTTRQWHRARTVMAALRAELDIPCIAGGLHPTFAPEAVLAASGIDLVCLGEGDEALIELLDIMERGAGLDDLPDIDNIWRAGRVRPKLRPPVADLDRLPPMARDLLAEPHGVVHITTQRGCPFPCTYCGARQFADLYDGGYRSYGRRRSVDNVLDELESLAEQGACWVTFLDDTFTLHHGWLRRFLPAYQDRVGLPFSIHARVETITPRLLDDLKAAGCAHVVYGVESGSRRIRYEVMQRPVENDRFDAIFSETRARGMLVTANYMLGLPTETPADLAATFALDARLEPDDFGFFVFYPYPGTALYKRCVELDLLPDDHAERPAHHRRSTLQLKHLTPAQLDAAYARFTHIRAERAARRAPPAQAEQSRRVIEASAALG